MATPLSPHFTLEELTATQQRALDNTPTPEINESLKRLANDLLEEVRGLLGPLHVNSGYRSPEVNRAVGGQPTSQHCRGEACDFVPLGPMSLKTACKILVGAVQYDQLIYEFGSWIHVSIAPPGRAPRRQALMVGSWTGHKYLPLDLEQVL